MRQTAQYEISGMTMAKQGRSRRAFWIKQLHQWHWISSAICLIAMILFSVTGITLNHAANIPAKPETLSVKKALPPELLQQLAATPADAKSSLPLPLHDWLRTTFDLRMSSAQALEWNDDEIYLSLPRPGGDAWVSIDLEDAEAEYQRTDRGWIAYLNDLHKGRNAGVVWSWFIDLFAVATLLFCITGLLLLQLHSKHRPSTWPIVIGGFFIPLVIALLFMH